MGHKIILAPRFRSVVAMLVVSIALDVSAHDGETPQPADLAALEAQAASLLSRLRGNREEDKPAAATEAIALAEKLWDRYFAHHFISSPNKVRDIDLSIAALHAQAARECLAQATELLMAVHAALPEDPAAPKAISLLSCLAWDGRQWEQCIRWNNVLLKDYPEAKLPGIVGKRHQFYTYGQLGHAQAKLGQSSAASESFVRAILSDDEPGRNISGWESLLSNDARLADSAILAKAMPDAQAELARRAAKAGVRIRLSLVPSAVPPGGATPPSSDDTRKNTQKEALVTIEYPGEDGHQAETLRNFRVLVCAFPVKRSNVLQGPAFWRDAVIWSSDAMTLKPSQDTFRRFTFPEAKLYTDRPVALLAELAHAVEAEKTGTDLDIPFPPMKWTQTYWSQPLLIDHKPATGAATQPAGG
jgi:hypothetical protein